MRHSLNDDRRLAEVKAVLKRLHRISHGPHADDVQTATKQAPPRHSPQAAECLVPEDDSRVSPVIETAAASDHPEVTKRRLVQAAIAAGALLVALAGIGGFMASNRRTASVAQPPQDAVRQDSVA